jgi:GT2 family glycosyltransferase
MQVSASLVLFHNDPAQYELVIRCFLNASSGVLCIVDNSSPPLSSVLFRHPRVVYVQANKNLGFGKAHNHAISLIANQSKLHLLLNPDIIFGPHVLSEMTDFLNDNSDVGAVMPKIYYPDGSLQHLCKLLPTPVDLILRRFIPSKKIKAKINRRYEMHGIPQDKPSSVPTLSGCFLLVRSDLLNLVGGFDERFFMYMEDVDLVRRIGDFAKTIYLPTVHVVHAYAKGSYRDNKLLVYHLRSAFLYFLKWGWLFDRTRRERNRIALQEVQYARNPIQ